MIDYQPKPSGSLPHATYAELAAVTREITHAEWEQTLGPDYSSLKHDPKRTGDKHDG